MVDDSSCAIGKKMLTLIELQISFWRISNSIKDVNEQLSIN